MLWSCIESAFQVENDFASSKINTDCKNISIASESSPIESATRYARLSAVMCLEYRSFMRKNVLEPVPILERDVCWAMTQLYHSVICAWCQHGGFWGAKITKNKGYISWNNEYWSPSLAIAQQIWRNSTRVSTKAERSSWAFCVHRWMAFAKDLKCTLSSSLKQEGAADNVNSKSWVSESSMLHYLGTFATKESLLRTYMK